MRTRTRTSHLAASAALFGLVALATACDQHGSTRAHSTPATTPTSPAATPGAGRITPRPSHAPAVPVDKAESAADHLADGYWSVYVKSYTDGKGRPGRLRFDVVQYVDGQYAFHEAIQDGKKDSVRYRDDNLAYYVRDTNPKLRELPTTATLSITELTFTSEDTYAHDLDRTYFNAWALRHGDVVWNIHVVNDTIDHLENATDVR